MTRQWIRAIVLIVGLVMVSASQARTAGTLRIATAKAWVGLARVTLAVDNLAVIDDGLEGTYEIRIPLMPLLNDKGTIRFELQDSLEATLERGGRISGSSFSTDGGKTRSVTCDVEPGGRVRISVETDNRMLRFKSRLEGAI